MRGDLGIGYDEDVLRLPLRDVLGLQAQVFVVIKAELHL